MRIECKPEINYVFTLPSGCELLVFFDEETGTIKANSSGPRSGRTIVIPRAGNAIELTTEKNERQR